MTSAARFSAQGWEPVEVACPRELGVSMHVNGRPYLEFQCLPQDLPALAVGNLYNENLIQEPSEIRLLEVCPDQTLVDVWLTHALETRSAPRRITSGCGGGESRASLQSTANPPALPDCPVLPAANLLFIVQDFLETTQRERIPGTHASALYTPTPPRQMRRCADIGRHNTLDKLAGFCLLEGLPCVGSLLISSGRISADMLQKAAHIGAAWVVSLRSATSQAVELAAAWNITTVSHAHRASFEVLTHPERISA